MTAARADAMLDDSATLSTEPEPEVEVDRPYVVELCRVMNGRVVPSRWGTGEPGPRRVRVQGCFPGLRGIVVGSFSFGRGGSVLSAHGKTSPRFKGPLEQLELTSMADDVRIERR